MNILLLLVPLSVVLILAILVLFAWALQSGQFEDLEAAGQAALLDSDQVRPEAAPEK